MASKYIKTIGGHQEIETWTVAGAVSYGDVLMVDPATNSKTAVVATSSAVDILGWAMETKTTATTTLMIDVSPGSIWEMETTATATQGIEYDLTDKDTVNVSGTSNKSLRCIKKDPGGVTTQGWFIAAKHFYGSGATT
jgi:hypothetical protein